MYTAVHTHTHRWSIVEVVDVLLVYVFLICCWNLGVFVKQCHHVWVDVPIETVRVGKWWKRPIYHLITCSMQMERSMKADHPECEVTPRKRPRHVPEFLPRSWKSYENIVRFFYNFRTQQTNWTIASNCMFSNGMAQDLVQQVDKDTREEARQIAQITWQVSSKRSNGMHFCK